LPRRRKHQIHSMPTIKLLIKKNPEQATARW